MQPLPTLPGVRHRDVDLGGVRLHLAEAGDEDAPPLLLVHGWPQHWWCWRRVVPQLADEFHCLMPDLRGHGWSSAPREGYEKRRLARDLVELLDAIGIERVGYVGHDWGAFAGFLVALESPERLSGLVALSIPHPWPSLRDRLNPWRLMGFAYQAPLSTPLLGRQLMRRGLARTVLRAGATSGTFSDEDLEVYDAVMRSPDRTGVTTAMYRSFLTRELPALVRGRYIGGRLVVPTRLLVGDGDPVARGADLGGHEGHADDMVVERVPDAAHFLPEERPDVVVDSVRALFGTRAARHPGAG